MVGKSVFDRCCVPDGTPCCAEILILIQYQIPNGIYNAIFNYSLPPLDNWTVGKDPAANWFSFVRSGSRVIVTVDKWEQPEPGKPREGYISIKTGTREETIIYLSKNLNQVCVQC